MNFLTNETNPLTLWLSYILLILLDDTTLCMITMKYLLALITVRPKFPRSHGCKDPTSLHLTPHPLPDPERKEKINLNFYFNTFLCCLKRFYEGLYGLHKTFWGTTKTCGNNNWSSFLLQYNILKCTEREKPNCTVITNKISLFTKK